MIAVEAGNPLLLADLGDLSGGDVLVALAAPGVPLGEYSRGMLSAANIEVTPVTFEADARGVWQVALGEVDAGIVYATDAASASNADSVVIPEAEASTWNMSRLISRKVGSSTRSHRVLNERCWPPKLTNQGLS